MIRFTCRRCGQHVRVSDDFGGKKGRCPFCQRVVPIPTQSEPALEGEQAGSPAAMGRAKGEPPPPPPPPPHATADLVGLEEAEAEFVSPGDPSHETDRLEAITEQESAPAAAAEPGAEAPPAAGPPGARKMPWLLIGGVGGGAALLVVIAVAAVMFWPFGRGGQPASSGLRSPPGTGRAAVSPVVARPREPLEAKTQIPLSAEIQAATARAPAGAFCMLHVDLAKTAEAVASIPSRTEAVAAAVASSALWSQARQRIAEGSMPTGVTLFLTGQTAPAGGLFGRCYGMVSGGKTDPGSGLWSLIEPESPVPHFLVRLEGPAARHYSQELLARARAMNLGGAFAADLPATHAEVRLAPAGLFGGREMLVGTVQTVDGNGACIRQPKQQQRLRELLMKVQTDRPVVGCVILPNLRGLLQAALGEAGAPPAWATGQTILVFAIDPGPDGLATLVVCEAAPGSVNDLKAEAEPMAVQADGPDIRITGLGTEAVPLMKKILPGFEEVVLKGLALAGPVRSRLPATTPPKVEPQPEPAPPPEPKPPPVPEKKEFVYAVCFYEHCPTRNQPFKVEKSAIPADVLAGTNPLKCPHCGKPTAVVAVQCPHCKKYYAQTIPVCPHCHKPRK